VLNVRWIPVGVRWMDVGREYFEAVLQRSNCETMGKLHKLSESSGFGGTMCAGMSISAEGAQLSTEATELSHPRKRTAIGKISL
jgi:hypothetical protein